MSKLQEKTKPSKRSNISDELLKRFSKLKTTKRTPSGDIQIVSPTGKSKAELEKLLLSVPLDEDVASFSDTGESTVVKKNSSGLPLYSDTYELSFCLPTAGYKSDIENNKKYKIRTSNSANHSPERSPENTRRASVRRTQSLNANTVTDRIWEIREKLAKKKREENQKYQKELNTDNTRLFEFRNKSTENPVSKLTSSLRRARSFNNNSEKDKITVPNKNNLKSSSVSQIETSDIDKVRQRFGGGSLKRSNKTSNELIPVKLRSRTTSNSEDNNKTLSPNSHRLQSNSFSTLQDAWEHRKPHGNDKTLTPPSITKTEADSAENHQNKDRRRLRRDGSRSSLASSEKSDSETEGEEGQLTEAALQRLERRSSRLALRRTGSLARRRARLDSDSNDENNNETSSEKTLDSGIFEITLSNLSEDISKLSKRYDSDEFILDDCISPKSGYSSATESLAESTTTFYDSAEDEMERNKKRPTRFKPKVDNTNVKTAVLNSAATRLNKLAATKLSNSLTANTSHSIENTTPSTPITKEHHDKKLTNKNDESMNRTNNKSTRSPNTSISRIKGSVVETDHTDKHEANKTQESEDNKSRKSSTNQVLNKFERKLSSSPNKSITLSTKSSKDLQNRKNSLSQSSQQRIDSLSHPQRRESVHHKGCSGAENMSNYNNISTSTPQRRKSSVIGPPKRKESIKHKTAQICTSNILNEKDSQLDKSKHDLTNDDNKNLIIRDCVENNTIKNNKRHDKSVKSNHDNISEYSSSNEDKMEGGGAAAKFFINKTRSSVDETHTRNRLVKQGESIELKISFDQLPTSSRVALAEEKVSKKSSGKQITVPSKGETPENSEKQTESENSKTYTDKPVASKPTKEIRAVQISTVSPERTRKTTAVKPEGKQPIPAPLLPKPKVQRTHSQSLNKGVQCILLDGETILSGKVINVSDTSKQATINDDVIKELGADILQDIQFTYPKYLIPPNQDTTDFPGVSSETIDPIKLTMENARLQQLLFEVERARAGTVKALLHVNTLFNKVQGENTRLEGDIKVCTQEKDVLTENLNILNEKNGNSGLGGTEVGLPGDSVVHKSRKETVDRSLSIIVESWKKEKKELMAKLTQTKTKEEDAEKAASRLRVQYKKVREQLDHSNNAFTMTLKNNLDATKRMETELKNSLEEKQELLKKCNEGNKHKREVERLKQEMEELKATNEEIEDEREQLEKKCQHLEKQKKHLLQEEEELHEQVEHSQELIDKLTDVEDDLKERLKHEIKEKVYLQECLDETGQILYQIKSNERNLLKDKDMLFDELEAELEEKETLQSTLSMTMTEHQDLVDRLQNMTNIHITVKESLQQANKKEKNYQDMIEGLTKTNHILHYQLEKEKEERLDLQEMFDIIETDHRKYKSETALKIRDLDTKCQELTCENYRLTTLKDELEKKTNESQRNHEQEEEEMSSLRQQLSRVEQLKEVIENELNDLRDNGEEIESKLSVTSKERQELEVDLKYEKQKSEKLTCALEDTEILLEKVTKEVTETKRKLDEYRCDYEDMQAKLKERHKRIRDMESSTEGVTEQRDKYLNRMNYYETETKSLRKKVNEQIEEIGTLQIESQRFARERDTHKRNCDMAVRDFEDHKMKCTETLKKLKEEILDLSKKITEKDRLAMKQKEQYQDQIDNTKSDLKFLRNMLDNNLQHKRAVTKRDYNNDVNSDSEKIDVNYLRNTHDKFRDEFQSHVEKLEDMLKESKECTDTITVVQSPMSKIKLVELKELRGEVFDVQTELTNVKKKFASLSVEITSLKLNESKITVTENSNAAEELETELSKLNDLITKIECRHKAVMSRNAIMLQRTLTADDLTAKDLVKKFQVVSLEGENKQLRTLLGILKRKYDFNEHELAGELQKITEDAGGETLPIASLTNGTSFSSDGERKSPSLPRKNISPRTDSNLRYSGSFTRQSRSKKNYSFVNEMLSEGSSPPSTRTYNRDLNLRSSGVSSYSSDDDDDDDDFSPPRGLPKRYNTLPSARTRKPRT